LGTDPRELGPRRPDGLCACEEPRLRTRRCLHRVHARCGSLHPSVGGRYAIDATDALRRRYRAPSASANTYLCLAGLAAAGADGIKRELVLPPAKDDEAVLLPTSLPEALAALRADEVLVEALGKDFVEWYDLVKRAELADVAANTARFAATGMDHDAAVQEAWNSLYFEFV
jgi:hypothetical protein